MSHSRPYEELTNNTETPTRTKVDRSKSAGAAEQIVKSIGERPRSQSSSLLIRRTLSETKAKFFDEEEIKRVRQIAAGKLVKRKKSSEMSLRKKLSRKAFENSSLSNNVKQEEKTPLLDNKEQNGITSPYLTK